MATRNLTEMFTMFRDRSSYKLLDQNFGLEPGSIVDKENNKEVFLKCCTNTEDWHYSFNQTQRKLDEIKSMTQRLTSLHAQHISCPSFENTSVKEKQNVDLLTQEITTAFNDCRQMIESMPQIQLSSQKTNGHLKLLHKNSQQSLLSQLQSMAEMFRKSQANYLHRIRQREEVYAPFEIRIEDGSENMKHIRKGTLIDMRELHELEQREKDIKLIMDSIVEINQVFKDVAMLINDQVNHIDRIDYNLEQTQIEINEGLVYLEQAENEHRKHRKLYVVVAASSVVILLIIILSLFLRN
ncbi:hypothetical protein ACOME3_001352 [Neoechinorhynchus agilis]